MHDLVADSGAGVEPTQRLDASASVSGLFDQFAPCRFHRVVPFERSGWQLQQLAIDREAAIANQHDSSVVEDRQQHHSAGMSNDEAILRAAVASLQRDLFDANPTVGDFHVATMRDLIG